MNNLPAIQAIALDHQALIAFFIAEEARREDEFRALEPLLKIDGLALQHLTQDQRNDLDLVLAAVSQNGLALQFAGPALRDNIMVARAAIAQNPDAALYASANVRAHLAAEAALIGLAMLEPIPDPMDEEPPQAVENPESPELSIDGSIYLADDSDKGD